MASEYALIRVIAAVLQQTSPVSRFDPGNTTGRKPCQTETSIGITSRGLASAYFHFRRQP